MVDDWRTVIPLEDHEQFEAELPRARKTLEHLRETRKGHLLEPGGNETIAFTKGYRSYVDTVLLVLIHFMQDSTTNLIDVVDACKRLTDRIKELESRPTLKYSGVFETARQYGPGEFVTHDGSLWHCNQLTHGAVPGFGNAWTLAAKRGRDRAREKR